LSFYGEPKSLSLLAGASNARLCVFLREGFDSPQALNLWGGFGISRFPGKIQSGINPEGLAG